MVRFFAFYGFLHVGLWVLRVCLALSRGHGDLRPHITCYVIICWSMLIDHLDRSIWSVLDHYRSTTPNRYWSPTFFSDDGTPMNDTELKSFRTQMNAFHSRFFELGRSLTGVIEQTRALKNPFNTLGRKIALTRQLQMAERNLKEPWYLIKIFYCKVLESVTIICFDTHECKYHWNRRKKFDQYCTISSNLKKICQVQLQWNKKRKALPGCTYLFICFLGRRRRFDATRKYRYQLPMNSKRGRVLRQSPHHW